MALSEILLVVAALAYLVCGVGIVKVLNAPEAVAPAWLVLWVLPRMPWAF